MERSVLKELIDKLNIYNKPDMLDGYLDELGRDFNDILKSMGLPTIEILEENS